MTRVVGDPESHVLQCDGLRIALGNRQILDGADLTASSGDSVAVIGPSGSGKTTLLRLISGLLVPDDGRVTFGSVPVSELSGRVRARFRLDNVGIVFQAGELLDELTVSENVALPLHLRGDTDADAIAQGVLSRVGLADRRDSWPADLSGGEVQRVAVARAIAPDPRLVVADEPTGSLDEEMSYLVSDLLLELTRTIGATLIVATHDPLVAGRMCHRFRLRRGKLEDV